MSKVITVLVYADKTLLVLSGASSSVSICLFAIVIGAPAGIESFSNDVVLLSNNGILEMFLKTLGKKKRKYKNIILLFSSKLNSIEKVISKALTCANISCEEFTLVSNETEY